MAGDGVDNARSWWAAVSRLTSGAPSLWAALQDSSEEGTDVCTKAQKAVCAFGRGDDSSHKKNDIVCVLETRNTW